jgi:hypothetical protein
MKTKRAGIGNCEEIANNQKNQPEICFCSIFNLGSPGNLGNFLQSFLVYCTA